MAKSKRDELQSNITVSFPVENIEDDTPDFANRVVARAVATQAEEIGHIDTQIRLGHYAESHSAWLVKYTIAHPRDIDDIYRHLKNCVALEKLKGTENV